MGIVAAYYISNQKVVYKLLSEPEAGKVQTIYQEWYWDACNENAPNASSDIDKW